VKRPIDQLDLLLHDYAERWHVPLNDAAWPDVSDSDLPDLARARADISELLHLIQTTVHEAVLLMMQMSSAADDSQGTDGGT
jgi:hypothetical protein